MVTKKKVIKKEVGKIIDNPIIIPIKQEYISQFKTIEEIEFVSIELNYLSINVMRILLKRKIVNFENKIYNFYLSIAKRVKIKLKKYWNKYCELWNSKFNTEKSIAEKIKDKIRIKLYDIVNTSFKRF